MQVPRSYGQVVVPRRSERQAITNVIQKIRRERRLREAADRERRRREKIAMLEFLARQRYKRRMNESTVARQQRYVRGLVTSLENSIGAGRLSGGVR